MKLTMVLRLGSVACLLEKSRREGRDAEGYGINTLENLSSGGRQLPQGARCTGKNDLTCFLTLVSTDRPLL